MNRKFLIVLATLTLTATGAQACNYQRQMSVNAIPDAVAAATPADNSQSGNPQDVAVGDVSVVNHLTTD